MTNLTVVTKPAGDVMEQVIIKGDLSQLTPAERVMYYKAVCASVGLNPLTKPFEYITLNGKLTLYARKDATDQLRDLKHVSITKLERERMDGLYVVTATAQLADGRQDSSIGPVSIEGLKGDALANGIMKAETKAKRRVTLSICGLGMTDESEIETIPSAQRVDVDVETGEIEKPEAPAQRVNFAWSDAPHGDSTVGEGWLLKAAQATTLTTDEIRAAIGDLHKYGSPDAAKAALLAKIAEAQAVR